MTQAGQEQRVRTRLGLPCLPKRERCVLSGLAPACLCVQPTVGVRADKLVWAGWGAGQGGLGSQAVPILCGSTLTRRIIWMAGCVLPVAFLIRGKDNMPTRPTGSSKGTAWPSPIIGLVH